MSGTTGLEAVPFATALVPMDGEDQPLVRCHGWGRCTCEANDGGPLLPAMKGVKVPKKSTKVAHKCS